MDVLKTIISKKERTETVKWDSTVYVHNGKNIIGIAGFKHFFTIWFFNGAKLKDENKVLINAQEDITKSMRQRRFTSIDEINEEIILQYIEEIMQL